jgi:BirA family biotin operon repressor/biotin-[acetyl-CoA-carboxylase] ligase
VIRWHAEALWEAVVPQLPGFTVEVLPEIDSTNTELMRRARTGQTEPTLLVAERQTAGRGRMGRAWDSGTDACGAVASLTFSLGLPLAPADWSGLSLAVGLAVAEGLDPHGSAGVRLKWPNDLWLADDRKLAGILVETASLPPAAGVGLASTRYVVIGIGINIAPQRGAPAPVAGATPRAGLQDVLPAVDAPAALARVLAPLVAAVQQFEAQGFAPLQARFAARDVLRGRAVRLSDGTEGQALGVDAQGAFMVQTAAGVQTVISNEISVRPHENRT